MKILGFAIYFCCTCGKLENEYAPNSKGMIECYVCCHGYHKHNRDLWVKQGKLK